MPTQETLNVFPLNFYVLLITMDWLAVQRDKMDFYDKKSECIDNEGEKKPLRAQKHFSLRYISTLQLK